VAVAPSRGRASAVESPPAAREAELAGALYERYSGQIYGFCLHRLGSREEAEDAVQTTFLNAFRGISRGVEPQAESAWLFKIAENVCLSRHRSSFRRRRVEAPSDLEALQDVLPGHEPEKDELHGLERVLERMPQTQRRAILLREWQGLSYREIADEMGITQAAVETLIFRARRSLAQGLEAAEHEPRRRRARRSIDAGSLAAGLKTFLGSAAAVKTAATVAVVTSATVVAVTPTPRLHHTSRPSAARAVHKRHVARVERVAAAPRAVTPVAAPVATAPPAAPVAHVVVRRHRPSVPAIRHAAVKRAPVTPHRVVPVAPAATASAPAPAAPPSAAPAAAAPPASSPTPAAPAPQPVASAPAAAPPATTPQGAPASSGGTQSGQKHHEGNGISVTPPSAGRGKGGGKGKKDKQHDRVPTPVPDRVPTNVTPPAADGSSDASAAPVAGGVVTGGSDGASAGVVSGAVSGSGSDSDASGSGSSGSGSGRDSGSGGSGSNEPTSGANVQRVSGTTTSSGSQSSGSFRD